MHDVSTATSLDRGRRHERRLRLFEVMATIGAADDKLQSIVMSPAMLMLYSPRGHEAIAAGSRSI